MLLLVGVSSFAQNAAPAISYSQAYYKTQTQIFTFQDARGDEVQVLTSRYEIPRAEVPQIFAAIPEGAKSTVLYSFNEKLFGSQIQDSPKTFLKGKRNFFLPLVETVKASASHIRETVKDDKIGLLVVTVNTAYDSFLWLHADSLSSEQKSAMILFNVVLSAAFGLDKDLWANMTQPLENRFAKFFDKYAGIEYKANLVASSFMSNLVFSMGIQAARLSIMSYPAMIDALSTAHFWGTSALMGGVITFTSFAWGEQLAAVDKVKNPTAKYILRRFVEIRTVLMGHLAPSSKLLQPEVYGYSAVVVAVVHGAMGLWTMLNSSKVVDMIESSRTFQAIYRATQKVDDAIVSAGRSCRALFSRASGARDAGGGSAGR